MSGLTNIYYCVSLSFKSLKHSHLPDISGLPTSSSTAFWMEAFVAVPAASPLCCQSVLLQRTWRWWWVTWLPMVTMPAIFRKAGKNNKVGRNRGVMMQGADGAGGEGELTLKALLLLTVRANKALCLLEIEQKLPSSTSYWFHSNFTKLNVEQDLFGLGVLWKGNRKRGKNIYTHTHIFLPFQSFVNDLL